MEKPEFWQDDDGQWWKVPTILHRLKSKCPGHRALREFIIRRDKVCQWCGTEDDLVTDHILSRRNGGSHRIDNLQALCGSCNSKKGNTIDKMEVTCGI